MLDNWVDKVVFICFLDHGVWTDHAFTFPDTSKVPIMAGWTHGHLMEYKALNFRVVIMCYTTGPHHSSWSTETLWEVLTKHKLLTMTWKDVSIFTVSGEFESSMGITGMSEKAWCLVTSYFLDMVCCDLTASLICCASFCLPSLTTSKPPVSTLKQMGSGKDCKFIHMSGLLKVFSNKFLKK